VVGIHIPVDDDPICRVDNHLGAAAPRGGPRAGLGSRPVRLGIRRPPAVTRYPLPGPHETRRIRPTARSLRARRPGFSSLLSQPSVPRLTHSPASRSMGLEATPACRLD
jgi:hypothetical protein